MRIVKFAWANIDRAQAEGETRGFIKLVLAGKEDELIRTRVVGARGGDLSSEVALAMQNKPILPAVI
jgi:pyruvate/2-oxoglutarate dehydrogenase complex dihydrolipoamide dehydrogenase (E3) component